MTVSAPANRVRVPTQTRSWMQWALVVTLFLLTVYPRERLLAGDSSYVGIAGGGVTVSPYNLAILGLAVVLTPWALVSNRPVIPRVAWAFVASLLLSAVAIWPLDAIRVGGVIHWLSAVAAWLVGSVLATRALANERGLRMVALAILLIASIECAVSVAQFVGIDINPSGQEYLEGRTNGTMGHPGDEGKNLFLLLIVCLALLPVGSPKTRRISWLAIAVMAVPLGLSQGRANIIAVVVAILLWAALSPSRSSRGMRAARWALPVIVLVALAPVAGLLQERFEEDPSGGPRGHLTAVGLQQIASDPFGGTGPNGYIYVVAQYDRYAADFNFPVHNSFLLTAAELGIVGALLLWSVVGTAVWQAFQRRKRSGHSGAFARALIAGTPGMLVILWTGWGGIARSVLLLTWFLLGIFYSQMHAPEPAYRRSAVARGSSSSPQPDVPDTMRA